MQEIKRVTVTDCRQATRKDGTPIEGEGTYGPWKLYNIMAVDDTGLPIQEKIKSFKPLNMGEQDLVFEADDHPEYGRSWKVKPLAGARSAPAASYANDAIEMTRESVRMLAERVAALEAHLGLTITGAGQTDVPGVVEPAVPVGAATDDSDEPPF